MKTTVLPAAFGLALSLLSVPAWAGPAPAPATPGTRAAAPATKAPAPAPKAAPAVTAPTGKTQADYQAAAAKVFDLSKLHRIDIVVAEEDAPKIVLRTDERVRCTFTFDGVVLKDVGIRQAGGVYHPYRTIDNKPSLSIKFDEFVKGQELFGLEKLVLKNFLQDMSLMNEHMTYEVFRRAGLPASLTAYAQVTLNGKPSGIYLMREPVNQQFLARNFGKGNEEGNLYELEINLGDFVIAPSAVELKDEVKEKRSRADIIALAAITSETPNEYFPKTVNTVMNLDRYIRYMAVEAVTSDMDGFSFHWNNAYMYALPPDGRFILIPHGADEAFWATGTMATRLNGPFQQNYLSLFARKVQSVPSLMDKYVAELASVSGPPVWDQAVLLERVAQVGRILATADRTGLAATEIARFEQYRPIVEKFIRDNGLTNTGSLTLR